MLQTVLRSRATQFVLPATRPHSRPSAAVLWFSSSSRAGAPSPGEGVGEKHPAATHEDGPIKKRVGYLKDTAKEAVDTFEKAAGKKPENDQVVRGDGTSGIVHDHNAFLVDDIVTEEQKKGKAAGGSRNKE